MSTPTTLNTFRVAWVSGSGDRSRESACEVKAVNWELDPSIGFVVFRSADNTIAFAINAASLVYIDRLTEGD